MGGWLSPLSSRLLLSHPVRWGSPVWLSPPRPSSPPRHVFCSRTQFAGGSPVLTFAVPSAGVSRWRAAFPPSGRSALALPPLCGGPLPLQARVLTAPKQRRHLLTQRPFDLSFRVCPGVGRKTKLVIGRALSNSGCQKTGHPESIKFLLVSALTLLYRPARCSIALAPGQFSSFPGPLALSGPVLAALFAGVRRWRDCVGGSESRFAHGRPQRDCAGGSEG